MLRVCALSFLIFHFGNADTIPTTEHEFELEPSYESNKTLISTNFDDSILVQSRAKYEPELEPSYESNKTLITDDSIVVQSCATVDANGCHKCSRTYLVGKEGVTFNQAVFLCNQIGMEIASITSVDEEKEMERIAYASTPEHARLWIGGKRCTDCLSEFIWISSGKPVVYRNFLANEPNNAENMENCLEIRPKVNFKGSYGWNDLKCDKKRGFVCQSRCCCNNN